MLEFPQVAADLLLGSRGEGVQVLVSGILADVSDETKQLFIWKHSNYLGHFFVFRGTKNTWRCWKREKKPWVRVLSEGVTVKVVCVLFNVLIPFYMCRKGIYKCQDCGDSGSFCASFWLCVTDGLSLSSTFRRIVIVWRCRNPSKDQPSWMADGICGSNHLERIGIVL